MSEYTHSGLGVTLRKREDQGFYEFGVVVDGGFIPFAARRIGDVQPEIDAAHERAQAEQQQQSDQQQQTS